MRWLYEIHHRALFYIYIYIYIASTPVQCRSGRIINYQINSYFWDKLLKSFHKDMNLILGSYVKAIDDMDMDYRIKVV